MCLLPQLILTPFCPLLKAGMCTCMPAKSLRLCPTLCNCMNCSLPGSSVHGILQARIQGCPLSGDLPGIEPASCTVPALPREFFFVVSTEELRLIRLFREEFYFLALRCLLFFHVSPPTPPPAISLQTPWVQDMCLIIKSVISGLTKLDT